LAGKVGTTATDFSFRATGLAEADAAAFDGCARLLREDFVTEDFVTEDSERDGSSAEDERGVRETTREETGISSTRLRDNDVIEMSESKLIVP
jgi:hypothetical protein